jgi:N-acetylglutamate synthase-like GNAT family acetyltransferase
LTDEAMGGKMVKGMKETMKNATKSKAVEEYLKSIQIRESLMPGDLGYLTHMHAKIYQAECGYDLEFEGYVCKTFYDFTKRYSPKMDRFFIAEKDGEIIGNIAILGHSEEEAQLRWFLIDPAYRGLGLGQELFQRAMNFCREMKYKRLWLLTTDDQVKATSMYTREGFELVSEEELSMWGRKLIERKYEMKL